MLELLEELNAQGATILVITHDHDLAARLPRQVQMLDGQIVTDTAHTQERCGGCAPTSLGAPGAGMR